MSILEKDISELSDSDFESFFDTEIEKQSIKEQSVVKGSVIRIEGDRVLVDINYKAEGSISLSEFMNEQGEVNVEEGEQIEVYLDSMNEDEGYLVLSKSKADQMKAWELISDAYKQNEVIKGTITHRVKGGLSVDIGVKAFLPGSQVGLRPMKNLEQLINREFEFRIIKFNRRRGNIVLSRRALLEEERKALREETLKKLKIDNIMTGKVKNITDYGAFIDLGGIDGLLHITDMTYARIQHPSELLKQGEEIQVKVLKFDEVNQRVSLGHKQIYPDPWEHVSVKYPIGCIVKGSVVNIEDYGVFVELETGIEGLIHVSEISWNNRVKKPEALYNVGDDVEALVQNIDTEERRISLSIKEITADPWANIDIRYPIGSVVTGRVRNLAEFGVFMEIEEGIDGLIHITDLSWSKRDKKPQSMFTKDQTISARVKDIDIDNRRFSLSIKDLNEDPWLSVQGRYFLGQVVSGKVVSHIEFGVFVEIEDGVDGLVHTTELINGGNIKESYPVGSELRVEIRRIDAGERRISLSEKGANEEESTSSELVANQNTPSVTLGEVFGNLMDKLPDEE
jgi:small subunit ribosomal protein S1